VVQQAENGISASEIIDREACMGSGNCLYWAPGVFDLDEAGVAVVAGDLAGNEENVRLAAKNCPTRAIRADAYFAG
jgi:ferredoxin